MKKLYFSLVLFLFSSLFILSGCYTSFRVQERESTYESVIPDSNQIVIQNYSYLYNNFSFQSGWHFGYRYPYWHSSTYWYNPWNNLWFGFYWDGYRSGIWNHWYGRPYFTYPHWNEKYQLPPYTTHDWLFRHGTRDNDGERGNRPLDVKKPPDQKNPPEGNTEERRRDVRPDDKNTNNKSDGNIRNDPNRDRTKDSRERIRDTRSTEKKSPQATESRKGISSDRGRKEPTRAIPQNNSNSRTREKSSGENPKKSNTTQDRERGRG